MTRMVSPEHRARRGPAKRRRYEEMRGREARSAPRRRHSGTSAAEARDLAPRFDVKVEESSSTARPRLRSEIGEVRGSLKRISEFSAREAAAHGGAGDAPSSTPSSQAAQRGTNGPFLVREAAVHGGAALSSSLSSQEAQCGTNGLRLAVAEPRPEAAAAAASASKRRKTIHSTEPPASPNPVPAKALHVVPVPPPERHDAEPDVLVRAPGLKARYAGLIAKATDFLRLCRVEDLERRRPDDADEGSPRARETLEALREVERNAARLAGLREIARETLREVERSARRTGLSVETIHSVELVELGIAAVEHVVSPERRRDRDGTLGVTPAHRPLSPLEELGLFVKPDDGGEQETETS